MRVLFRRVSKGKDKDRGTETKGKALTRVASYDAKYEAMDRV